MMRNTSFGPLVRVFFLKNFLCFFSTLIHIHNYYRYYSDTDKLMGDYDEENWPK